MGAVTFGIPKKLVILLKTHFNLEIFIETGTFKGMTTRWASGNFRKVYTVENSKPLYNDAVKNLQEYKNITCLYGNSALQLKSVLAEIKQPALLWLDAHWCGGSTYGDIDPCPLLEEIQTVKQSEFDHIIMIDDARFFLKPPPDPQNAAAWPGLKEIMELLNKDKSYFTFVSEDVIVSMPIAGRSILQPYFNEIHKNEFPGGSIVKNFKAACRNIYRKWVN